MAYINSFMEKYTMTNADWDSVDELTAQELARYDIRRIEDQMATDDPNAKFYNTEVLKKIQDKAYQECVAKNGKGKCTKQSTAYKHALNAAQNLTARNKEATCNDTFNLYKQHLDNILNISTGGVIGSSATQMNPNKNLKTCLGRKSGIFLFHMVHIMTIRSVSAASWDLLPPCNHGVDL